MLEYQTKIQTSQPENNDMFSKSELANQKQLIDLHKTKRQQVDALEKRFQKVHKGNKNKDAPFNSMQQQDFELERIAARQLKKINEVNKAKEDKKLAHQKH